MGFIGDAVGGIFGGIQGGAAKYAPQSGFTASSPGLPGYAPRMQSLSDQYGQYGQDIYGQNKDLATQQNAYINTLQNQAAGNGPSVAQAVMDRANQQNLANSNALAGSARGDVNPGMLARMAQTNQANTLQNNASTAMIGKQQEQLNAQQQLGGALQTARAQDIQTQQLQQQLQQQYEQMGMSAAEAELQAAMQAQQINAGVSTGNLQARTQFGGAAMGGLGAGLGAIFAS